MGRELIISSLVERQILLDARSIYPNISKLALAFEKNLSVTSMLSISRDPCTQSAMQKLNEQRIPGEEPNIHSDSVQNGVDSMVGDRDEVMVEVEQDIDEDIAIAMEVYEDIVDHQKEIQCKVVIE